MAQTRFSGPVVSDNGFEGPFTATQVQLQSTNANSITLDAPASLAASYNFILPPNDGTNGQVLTTDGSGVTTWTTNGAGTVTSVATAGTVNGLTLTGGTITSSGTITLGGTLSNVDLATAVTGTLPIANGGTGNTSYTDGQLLIGNTTGNTLTKATLTAGTNVGVTNGNGSITLAVVLPNVSAASVGALANAINTTGKVAGKMVVDYATGIIYTATGSAAADAWAPSDASGLVTPS